MYEVCFRGTKCVVVADSLKDAVKKLIKLSPDIKEEEITSVRRLS